MAVNSTTEEYEGVELEVMLLFLMELIEQATAAKVSYGQLVAALEIDVPLHIPEQDDGEIPVEYHGEINRYLLDSRLKMARIFLAVQGVLTSAAPISKLLWMSQPQRREGCTCPPRGSRRGTLRPGEAPLQGATEGARNCERDAGTEPPGAQLTGAL